MSESSLSDNEEKLCDRMSESDNDVDGISGTEEEKVDYSLSEEQLQAIKKYSREMPPTDSLSYYGSTLNSIAKSNALDENSASSTGLSQREQTMSKEDALTRDLLETVPLPNLFPALDYASNHIMVDNISSKDKLMAKESKKYLLIAIKRIFTCRYGSNLLTNPDLIQPITIGLFHSDLEIRKMTSYTLFKALERRYTPNLAETLRNSELMSSLVTQISDPEISVGQYSGDALLQMIFQEAENDVNGINQILDCIEEKISPNSNIRSDSVMLIRYVDFLCKAAGGSSVMGSLITSLSPNQTLRPCFRVILDMLHDDRDPLTQMTVIESLLHFCNNREATLALFRHGIVQELLEIAEGKGQKKPDPILGPSAMRVLGQIYHVIFVTGLSSLADLLDERKMYGLTEDEGKQISLSAASTNSGKMGQHNFLPLIQSLLGLAVRYIDSSDDNNRLSALHSIAAFATGSLQSFSLVMKDKELITKWIAIRQCKSDLKTATIHSLAEVIREAKCGESILETDPEAHSILSQLKKQLFESIGTYNNTKYSMEYLFTLLKMHITPELRYAVYDLLGALACQPEGWGLRYLFGYSGAREFLLNRWTEETKEGKEWKFSVIENVMKNPSREILGEDILEELTGFLKQGPFYAGGGETSVSTAI